jgi:hypothetical protein
MIDLRITMKAEGPLFTGGVTKAIHDALEESKQAVAEQGNADLHALMGQSFRNPTGYFESNVRITNVGGDVVVDDPVIYGPWLEGTGSRNNSTRFKGYAIFRRTAQALERKATSIVATVFSRYNGRMN